jgi:hypothetical protein
VQDRGLDLCGSRLSIDDGEFVEQLRTDTHTGLGLIKVSS